MIDSIFLFHTPDTSFGEPHSSNTEECGVVSYRDDVLFVDNWLVKSQQSDVILERGRVVRFMDRLASDLVVLVWQPLALVSDVPLTKANLKFQRWSFLKHELKSLISPSWLRWRWRRRNAQLL